MAGVVSTAGRSTAITFGVGEGVESGEESGDVNGEREKSSSTKRSSAGSKLVAVPQT